MAKNTIVLTGGGTAGHVIPNLNLLPLLLEHFDRIVYIGSKNGIEHALISEYPQIEFFPIETVKLKRSLSLQNLLIPAKLMTGRKQAIRLLKEIEPSVIFSKGGFVSVPVALASKKLNIPLISHESDYTLGLANKLTQNYSTAICTTFKDTAERLKNGIYVGAPLPCTAVSQQDKMRARQMYNLNSDKPLCLIVGGSLGAESINKNVWGALDTLLKTHQVLHITGKGKLNSEIKREGYTQVEFVSNMPALLEIADVAITRGGSNMIFELLAHSIPMLIIPLSKGSRGDQVENAEYFEQKGYSLTLLESELTPDTLASTFTKLIERAPLIRAQTRHAVPKDSLEKILSIILKNKKAD
ncbi:MAG: UDP-N-acetylglucosamine--N-acetylmuramyl-(pentapeptide) pyrophosphoryl-undecaprenol N-acetylglucosamine transferase [Clostridia bacterium]|nr:UDP-N-acetylglucosamine--N-acetylmuramyl-(pentapeptide) pyrophosphoryl-undecaprenol N-acetylglucosamine transferase [Clostridia bacterium]